MSQIFISYSRKDIEFVDRLANDLTNAGFKVWYDLSGLEAGSQWGNEIQKAIDASQYFLVVLSQNSVQSNWVEREFLRASDQGLKIIPILYQKCRLPLWSLNLHFIDMQGKNYARKYQELLKLMGVQSTLSEDNPIALNYIKIGDEYRKIGQPNQAIASYLQALNVDPNSLKAQYSIGAIHLEEQAFKEAAEAFKLALQISENDLLAKAGFCDACMSMGNQARADGEIEEAISLYKEILKVAPDDDNARRSLANIFKTKSEDVLAAGKEEEALEILKDALAYTPHDKSMIAFHKKLQDEIKTRQLHELFTRSNQELAVRNWEKAIDALNEALEIAPQDASIVKKIENIQEQRQEEKLKSILLKVEQAEETERWDTAIAGLNEYLQIKRDDKVIQKRMAELMASKRSSWLNAVNLRLEQAVGSRKWEEALAVLNEALEVEPDNKELRAREAQVRQDRKTAGLNAIILRAEQAASVGRWDDAIEILNSGLIENHGEQNLKSKLAEVHQAKREEKLKSVLNLADIAARAEKWETAVSSLNEILASEPDNPVFLEKFDEILRLERASKLKELQTRARNLVKAEKFDEALAAWNEQLALQPENRQAVLNEIEAVNKAQKLADLYAKGMDSLANKEYVRAVDYFKRIEIEDTKYKDTARQLAKAEKRLGDAGKTPNSQRRKYLVIGTVLLVAVIGVGTFAFLSKVNTDLLSILPKETDLNGEINNQVINTPDSGISNPITSPTLEPEDTEIIVTSAEDDGVGTLRHALSTAQPGDTVLFDPVVFPPDNATIIYLRTTLQRISQGNITIDASNAGVILDGSFILDENPRGLILNSDGNTIMGLKFINFESVGIYLEGGSFNTIGGDRTIGTGPSGQGNIFIAPGYAGIDFLASSRGNIITGNLIGTDGSDNESLGFTKAGIWLEGDASKINTVKNIIGPDNVIANNGKEGDNIGGIVIESVKVAPIITANEIYNNAGSGISYFDAPDADWDSIPDPPLILYFELETGIASGQTCANCQVEIFSTDSQGGKIFEGKVAADRLGGFKFNKGGALTGPFLTATALSVAKNTSEFSMAASERSDFQIGLDSIADKTPDYEDDFSNPASGWPTDQNSRGETGYKDGEYLISSNYDCYGSSPPTDRLFSDFVLEMDVRFINQVEGAALVIFRDNTPASYGANLSPSGWFNFHKNVNGIHIELLGTQVPELSFQAWDTSKHLTLIARQDRMAFYVNGNFVIALSDTSSSQGAFNFGVCSSTSLQASIDNLKIWDISDLSSLNPSTEEVETPVEQPSWVTDFAEPIIRTIDQHVPNASTDFNQYPHWLKVTDCPEYKIPKAVDGVLIWDQFCPLILDRWYTDFVIDMQVRHLDPLPEQGGNNFACYFRNSDGSCSFSSNGEVRCNGMLHPLVVDQIALAPTDPYHIRIIVQEYEYGLFINDHPLYHGSLSTGYKSGEISWWPGGVAFDSMTIWDLNNLIKP